MNAKFSIYLILIFLTNILLSCQKKNSNPTIINDGELLAKIDTSLSADSLYDLSTYYCNLNDTIKSNVNYNFSLKKKCERAMLDQVISLLNSRNTSTIDTNKAIKILQQLVLNKNCTSFFIMGAILINRNNIKSGLNYLQGSTSFGCFYTAFNLGILFETGENTYISKKIRISEDIYKAIYYYKIATVHKYSLASLNLANLYYEMNQMDSAKKYLKICIQYPSNDEDDKSGVAERYWKEWFK